MPNVRIAWYSNWRRAVYHVCQNCRYSREILSGNLVVGTEEQVINTLLDENPDTDVSDLLCGHCERLLERWRGIILVLPVT